MQATARPWDCPKGGAGDKGGAASANKDAAAELRAKIMSGIKRPREEKGGGHKKENGKAVKGEEGHAGAVKAEEGLEGAVEIEGSDAGQGGSKGETKTTTAFWDALAVKKEENGADETPPKKAKLENGAPGTEEKISEEDRLEVRNEGRNAAKCGGTWWNMAVSDETWLG